VHGAPVQNGDGKSRARSERQHLTGVVNALAIATEISQKHEATRAHGALGDGDQRAPQDEQLRPAPIAEFAFRD